MRRGTRYEGPPEELLEVRVEKVEQVADAHGRPAQEATVLTWSRGDAAALVDADGKRLELPAYGRTLEVWKLYRGPATNGKWRVFFARPPEPIS